MTDHPLNSENQRALADSAWRKVNPDAALPPWGIIPATPPGAGHRLSHDPLSRGRIRSDCPGPQHGCRDGREALKDALRITLPSDPGGTDPADAARAAQMFEPQDQGDDAHRLAIWVDAALVIAVIAGVLTLAAIAGSLFGWALR